MSRHMFRLVTIALARLAGAILLAAVPALAQEQSVTVRAARVLDGKGGTLAERHRRDSRTARSSAIDQRTGPVTHDLGDVTLMPGLIDVHVHIGYHFGKDGRAQNQGETPAEMALYAAENAWTTLINGFTTVQSVGAASDKELRDAINRGVLPGPRILTSLGSMNERTRHARRSSASVRAQAEGRPAPT